MTSARILQSKFWTRQVLGVLMVAGALGLAWLAVPEVTLAQGLLPACAENGDCSLCDVVGLFINFAALITQWVGLFAVLMFIIGGVFVIISGGNPERVKRGRQIIGGALIGILIVMSGWFIINFTLAALLNADFTDVQLFPATSDSGESTGGGELWYELACTPVYPECSTALDGASCSDSECTVNCVCYTGGCIPLCDYQQNTAAFAKTYCAQSEGDCGTGETAVENWCNLGPGGAEQVCCVQR